VKASDVARDLEAMTPRSLHRSVVIVEPEDAGEVAIALRLGMAEMAHRDSYTFRASTRDVLNGLIAAARLSRVVERVNSSIDQNSPSGTVEHMDEATVAEAVEITGISRQAINARIKRGTLPARKGRNGRYLISLCHLEAS
jgi:hypothetical protein